MNTENIFKKGDFVIHTRQGLCVVNDVCEIDLGLGLKRYYDLSQYFGKDRSNFKIPVDNCNQLRTPINKNEAERIINSIKRMENLWINDSKKRKLIFQDIIEKGNVENIICLLKTIFNKRAEFQAINKNLPLTDINISQSAERIAYQEFALVYKINPQEAQEFISKYF